MAPKGIKARRHERILRYGYYVRAVLFPEFILLIYYIRAHVRKTRTELRFFVMFEKKRARFEFEIQAMKKRINRYESVNCNLLALQIREKIFQNCVKDYVKHGKMNNLVEQKFEEDTF